MAYRRFVTYLFQYKNGRKEENCGFAKVEVRQERARMEIQVRGVPDGTDRVYLFALADGMPVGAYIGNLMIREGAGRVRLVFDAGAVGGTLYGMEEMAGIYILSADGFLASQWVDEELDWDSFREYEPPKAQRDDEISIVTGNTLTETSEEMETGDDVPTEILPQENPAELHATQAEAAVRAETPKQQTRISSYINTWERQWRTFTGSHPLFCPFDEAPEILAVKMDLRDFKLLPKTYLPLANNSFLLHGYFNYKYLLFGYMDGEPRRWFLGVPGVFQNQEQLLAGLFGFGEFRTKHLTKQKTGEFGYWYRYLEL